MELPRRLAAALKRAVIGPAIYGRFTDLGDKRRRATRARARRRSPVRRRRAARRPSRCCRAGRACRRADEAPPSRCRRPYGRSSAGSDMCRLPSSGGCRWANSRPIMNPASAGFAHDGRWNARAPGTRHVAGPDDDARKAPRQGKDLLLQRARRVLIELRVRVRRRRARPRAGALRFEVGRHCERRDYTPVAIADSLCHQAANAARVHSAHDPRRSRHHLQQGFGR